MTPKQRRSRLSDQYSDGTYVWNSFWDKKVIKGTWQATLLTGISVNLTNRSRKMHAVEKRLPLSEKESARRFYITF